VWPSWCSSSWGFVVVSRCRVGCGVVNWSLGVALQFVVSLGYAVLGRLSCGCIVRGIVVLVRLIVALDRFGIEIRWNLGVVG
jgi:hypothetical protein